jgi:hypothetical protein
MAQLAKQTWVFQSSADFFFSDNFSWITYP